MISERDLGQMRQKYRIHATRSRASKEWSHKSNMYYACGDLLTTKTNLGLNQFGEEMNGEQARTAIRNLCNAYTGIVKCFNSISSPYGEQEATEESAINEQMTVEEVSEIFSDFYESGGVLQ